MTVHSKGRELFIVDNSVSGWTGLRYLEEWCGIAKSFDIATGYFEIGALLALDGKWQREAVPPRQSCDVIGSPGKPGRNGSEPRSGDSRLHPTTGDRSLNPSTRKHPTPTGG